MTGVQTCALPISNAADVIGRVYNKANHLAGTEVGRSGAFDSRKPSRKESH